MANEKVTQDENVLTGYIEDGGLGYFDINTYNDNKNQMWDISELFYVRDLNQRKLFLNESIYQEEIDDVVHHILQFNAEDKGLKTSERMPILLYLSSNGGSVDVGFQLIDVIVNSKTPIYTVNLGYQYSMGFLIGIAGHKRFATKHAKFLMHDGFTFAMDSSAKAADMMEFRKKQEEPRIREYILSRTKITPEEYDENFRKEWYMYSEEAKEKGIVDCIIGEDCDIDEIV